MVTAGLATGLGILFALKPVAGVQLYEVAPLASNDTLLPEQMVADDGATVTVGVGLTVTLTVCVALHPLLVPVTV